MNFIRVENSANGATFLDLDKVESVSVLVSRTPEQTLPPMFDIAEMAPTPGKVVPATAEIIVTLTAGGRDYVIRYSMDESDRAHDILNKELKISVPFEIFE